MIAGGSKCCFAGPDCEGRLEWHHAIKQQRLKREFPHGAYYGPASGWVRASRHEPIHDSGSWGSLKRITLDDILGDTRNRVWLCSRHHELVTNGRLKVELPEQVWEFAREFGLEAQLENDEARRAA